MFLLELGFRLPFGLIHVHLGFSTFSYGGISPIRAFICGIDSSHSQGTIPTPSCAAAYVLKEAHAHHESVTMRQLRILEQIRFVALHT